MREFDWIRKYAAPLAIAEGAAGFEDDVAALREPDGPIAITMDTLVEGVHFLTTDPIETIARKLVRVNVSDLLAKGARPSEALLSVAWPEHRQEEDFGAFFQALGEELDLYEAGLIGGDTVSTAGPLVLTLTFTGDCAGDGPVRRSDADIGDDVWVTGLIGAGGLGLEAARMGQAGEALNHYRCPNIPPLSAADMVADYANASMDVSDGLLADAAKLASASGAGIAITLDRTPFARAPESLEQAVAFASAGDDYQILLTANSDARAEIESFAEESSFRVTRIGTLSEAAGLRVFWAGEAVNLPERLGFEHEF